MSSAYLEMIFDELRDHVDNGDAVLNPAQAATTRIGDLGLDSLDLLEFTMRLETKLDMDIEADFPEETTLLEVAQRLEALKQEKETVYS